MKFLSNGKNYFTIFILFILNCAVNKEFVQTNFDQQDLAHPNETKPAGIKLSDSSLDKQKKERILTYKGNLTLEISSGQSDLIRSKIYEYLQKIEGHITSETTYSVSLKIPASKYRDSIQYFKTLGKVIYESYVIEDITEAYYDSKTRLENLQKLQARLAELLQKARNVQEAIEVEKELNRVTSEIETYKSKLFRLENQAQYSLLNIQLKEKSTPGPIGWVFYVIYRGLRYLFVID